jgi:surface antigen
MRRTTVLAVAAGICLSVATGATGATGAGSLDPAYEGAAAGVSDANLTDCDDDQWGFCRRNCTSYVAYRLNTAGVPFTNWYRQPAGSKWGHAKYWWEAADRAGIARGSTPRVGAVAYWTGGDFGHVAMVETVNTDGSARTKSYDGITETFEERLSTSSRPPNGYIYFTSASQPGPAPPSTTLLYWHLSNTFAASVAQWSFTFGTSGMKPVKGNWDGVAGDGKGAVVTVDGKLYWHLSEYSDSREDVLPVFQWGVAGDTPIVGDWNGDGRDEVGIVRTVSGALKWFLRNSDGTTTSFGFGAAGDVPVVGNWDGVGSDSKGVVRASGGKLWWYLSNRNDNNDVGGFAYGEPPKVPVVGDWDGIGGDGIGIAWASAGGPISWLLRNSPSAGAASVFFTYGAYGMTPITGDWNGDGTDTQGAVSAG